MCHMCYQMLQEEGLVSPSVAHMSLLKLNKDNIIQNIWATGKQLIYVPVYMIISIGYLGPFKAGSFRFDKLSFSVIFSVRSVFPQTSQRPNHGWTFKMGKI